MLDQERITQFLTAIGDPIRLQIIFVLHGDRLNVGEITSRFTISRPAVSHHLKVLKDAKVLQSEKVGQEVFYWVNKRFIVEQLRGLAEFVETTLSDDQEQN